MALANHDAVTRGNHRTGAMSQLDFNYAIGESVKPPATKGVSRHAEEPARPRKTVAAHALWLLLRNYADGSRSERRAAAIKAMWSSKSR